MTARHIPAPAFKTAFTGANALYIAGLHAAWVRDPTSVDPTFAELFDMMNEERAQILSNAPPLVSTHEETPPTHTPRHDRAALGWARDSVQALQMIRAYRVRSHLESRLDPLGLHTPPRHADLDPATYGFTQADRNHPIFFGDIAPSLLGGRDTATLDELLDSLRAVYCGPIGAEYMHVQDPAPRHWLQARLEGDNWRNAASPDQKRKLLQHLTEAEGFENFCHRRFVGTKRFGLEGGEVTIAALHAIIDRAASHGVESVALGMPHRGRLNTMANIIRKPFAAIFAEFAGASFKPDDVQGSGDVKYHLGTATTLTISGQEVQVSLLPNPSHLEAVDPVVVGRVRAHQDRDGVARPEGRTRHLGLLVHGDAAFAGQGIVYETMAMSQLIGYRTGGTIHVVINNQIGFTTVSAHAYSGLYCTDIAKAVQAPILHVNGDEPEAVAYCAQLAADYRQTFGADIVLDIVCYRRHGHNEADEPSFTQPSMYKAIAARPTARTLYATRLEREGVLTAEAARAEWDAFQTHLDGEFQHAQNYKPNRTDWLEHPQDPTRLIEDTSRGEPETGLPEPTLSQIGQALTTVPNDVTLHPRILRQLRSKAQMFQTGNGLDWATGEALAFGGLLLDGHRVRLSGEDCQRGTFSHRHAVLIDQVNQNEYVPLNTLVPPDRSHPKLEIYNSLLSEFGVLGFEYGYSLGDPDALVLWEAQFGDFANGAQVIIDQFIASGETKWLRMSGLVMLLPHGYEGQGPEHSSARLERYLQLCAENNLRVCNLTTPANYFHALRRQIARDCRKPLIIMTPKSLLRHKEAISPLTDFGPGTSFLPVIDEIDTLASNDAVKRVVLCSGKVYYDLLAERRRASLTTVALIRVEQLYPFPQHALEPILGRYPNARIVWCQEEPQNAGAWFFVDHRIETTLQAVGRNTDRPCYAGREAAASPATGLATIHAQQQAALVASALGI